MLSRSVISCLQTELTAIVMEDFIHFLQAVGVSDLSHVTYVRTATNGNKSVVTPNLKKGFFAVTTYWHLCLLICEVRWFEKGHVVDITE